MRIIILFIWMIWMTGCTQNTGFWGPVLEVAPPNSVMGRYDVTLSSGRKLIASETNSEIQIDVIAMTNDQYCKQKWFEYVRSLPNDTSPVIINCVICRVPRDQLHAAMNGENSMENRLW